MRKSLHWVVILQLSSAFAYRYGPWYRADTQRPVDVITDVVNDLGVRILQQYSAHGNVAFSPTGVAFVLAALYEGSAGRGNEQIVEAMGLPSRDITRIGFRDIHRRLRTYLNADGFLGGLTLNRDDIGLRPEYEDILRFYGFDLSSIEANVTVSTGDSSSTTELPTSTIGSTSSEAEATGAGSVSDTTTTATTTTSGETVATLATDGTRSTAVDDTQQTVTTPASGADTQMTLFPVTEGASSTPPSVLTASTSGESVQPSAGVESAADSTTTPAAVTGRGQTGTVTTVLAGQSPPQTPPTVAGGASGTDAVPNASTENIGNTTPDDARAPSTAAVSSSAAPPTTNASNASTTADTRVPTTATTSAPTTSGSLTPAAPMMLNGANVTVSGPEATVNNSVTSQPSTVPSMPVTVSTEITPEATTNPVTMPMTAVTVGPENATTAPPVQAAANTSNLAENSSISAPADSTTNSPPMNNQTTANATTNSTPMGNQSVASPVNENTISNRKKREIEIIELNLKNSNIRRGETARNRRKRSARGSRDYFSTYSDEGIWMQDLEIWKSYGEPVGDSATEISFLVNGCDVSLVSASSYIAVLPFAYFPSLHAVALEFPLDDPRYNIILLMPTDKTDAHRLARDLSGKSLRSLRKRLQPTWVRATIPSFTLHGFVTLTSFLQRLGILDVFEPRAADLSPMTSDLGVYARDVQQSIGVNIRNYMKPDRTHSRNGLFERAEPVPFTALHPFLYFIIDAETSVSLIAGRVDDPLNSRIL